MKTTRIGKGKNHSLWIPNWTAEWARLLEETFELESNDITYGMADIPMIVYAHLRHNEHHTYPNIHPSPP